MFDMLKLFCVRVGVMFRGRRTAGFWVWSWTKTITPCLWPSAAVSSESR